MAEPAQLYDTVTGKTMCTYDFYEGKDFRPNAILIQTPTQQLLSESRMNYLATHFPDACFNNARRLST
jgi:hypothetical protein